ncbi:MULTISPECIES: carbohydrate ABC transporter permease [Rhizobium]|jgi:ABC-type sugar transport system permease subunit|uniref:ABC transporter permease n=2 Tax=Rhizobium TaxID=379 RepID=A0A2K9ZCB9_RHILE|nr:MULTISPECIES: sugar ABC transporter permease [Rhizobium]AUW45896.1 ABC transporter permease [Rhizobium leguminosarum]WSH83263.1 sugar ABC transporter permease [Rhizobium beringeri]
MTASLVKRTVWRSSARQFLTPDLRMTLLLLLPSLILMLVVIGYPMIQGFWYSFTNGSLLKAGKFVGLRNYGKLLTDPSFWHALRFSLYFAVANIVGCYSLGLGLALLLQKDFPGRGLFRVLLLLPWIVPSLVAIVSWRWMINDDKALFNQIIVFFGGDPVYFLSSSNWTIAMVIVIKIWRSFPFMLLSLLAALQTIDRTLYEAADIDGATKWQSFRHVTMPAISGISVVLCLLMTVWTVNDFDTPWLLAQGGPANATENLVVLAYRYTFARNDVGMGAAVSFVTLAILMVIFTVVLRLQREKR